MPKSTEPDRLIRKPEVCSRTGYSPATLDRREREGAFPRRVRLGPAAWSPVAWSEREVDEWIAARLSERGSAA